jgi:hypothetical protein
MWSTTRHVDFLHTLACATGSTLLAASCCVAASISWVYMHLTSNTSSRLLLLLFMLQPLRVLGSVCLTISIALPCRRVQFMNFKCGWRHPTRYRIHALPDPPSD